MEKVELWSPGDPIREVPRAVNKEPTTIGEAPSTEVALERDPLVDLQQRVAVRSPAARSLTNALRNFDGQPFSGAQPPDTVGDTGRRFYIQMLNSNAGSNFAVYDKSDGSLVAGPSALDGLGTGDCATGHGDPIVVYDQLADRWILSEFSQRADKTLCVYVSMTNDPTTGGWYAYAFEATEFPDYPKYAVWNDGYYVSSNESDPTVYVFDRAAMLAGNPATFQTMTAPGLAGFGFQALQPGDLDGSTPAPTNAPAYYIRHRDDEVHNPASNDASADFLEIFELSVDFSNAANTTLTGPLRIPIADFDSDLCGLTSFSCFEQPSPGPPLDPLREVVMWRLQYRNFGSHEAMVGSFVTDVNRDDQGGIRWFELRKKTGGQWDIFQEGTYSPDNHNRWMSSIASDRLGNIAMGYSVGGTTLSAGIRYTGRLASDPAGTMPQPEVNLVSGSGSNSSIRWGDYSALTVDPVDDCTFWYTHEYAQNNLYATRIGSFRFDTCAGDTEQKAELSYAAKFVCGKSDGRDKPVRGLYSTTINIHNPGPAHVVFSKHAVLALSQREDRGAVSRSIDEKLRAGQALGVDCRDIRKLFSDTVPELIEGYLVLRVPAEMPELDVVGVYTAGGELVQSIHLETFKPRELGGRSVGGADLVPVPDERGSFCRRDDEVLLVEVRNQGTARAEQSITTVNFGSFGSASEITAPLDPNASTTHVFKIPLGCHDPDCGFTITVDANAEVPESNETNNVASDVCIG
jgi:hypothetical protein